MAINFKDYKPNIAERRVTTYKIESPDKVTVDNSDSVGYNGSKETNSTITPSTDYSKQWLDKNQGLLKYAGDNAKKSIHAGLDEAPSFMRDADEGTSFADVQTASVKRNLAKDSNNNKLHNSALMEMIGHLSKDNKGPYLKHTLPLHTYIDAKDEFDFKQNYYTTTKNIDTTPDEKVRQLQRELNESGYTDKFGEPLKEDGIYAGKTAYADDSKKADLKNKSQRYTNKSNSSSREQSVSTNGTYTEAHNNATKKDNSKPFSKDDLTIDEYMKIGKYLYGDDFDPNILTFEITDDGMVMVPQMVVSLPQSLEPVYEPVANILNNSENIKVASANYDAQFTENKSRTTYEKKLEESAKINERSVEKARKSSEVISRNSKAIIDAGKKYGVNPAIIASCIYTEQIRNVNFRDTLTDTMLYCADTSIGIGQVKDTLKKPNI